MTPRASTLLLGAFLTVGQVTGCDERRSSADVAVDLPVDAEMDAQDDAPTEPTTPQDMAAMDLEVRTDATVDRRDGGAFDADATARVDADAPPDEGVADDDATVRFLDRPAPMDGPVEGIDATAPDEGAVAFDVGDGCTVARFEGPYDAGPPCTPGRTRACSCSGGRRGAELCEYNGTWGYCVCSLVDAGISVVDGQVIVPERPIPWIGRPRLIAPQSGMRVTSQRPTLRWMRPSGIDRARVELCADRPCARVLAQQELRGDRWRPTAALPAGVVFWRVRGLDAAGAVRWTSATWEFGVRHRDLGVDTSYGPLKDFNGDGYDDLVTTEEANDSLLVYPGSARGITSERVVSVEADDPMPRAFEIVHQTGIGDFNGDGLADLAFGVIPTRRVEVRFGARACTLVRTGGVYRATFYGGVTDETAAVSAGDFNGDGYADLITNSLRMQLHTGGPAGLAETPADISELTSNFAAFVGDINGDGYQDILSNPVGPNREIAGLPLLVIYGNPEGRLDFQVDLLPNPRGTIGYFGYVLRWSDLNEDGYADAVVSFPGDGYVYYGSPAGYTRFVRLERTKDSLGDLFGNFGGYTAHPVDVDGDGHAEVFVGNPLAPFDERTSRDGPGRLFVFRRDPETGLVNGTPALIQAAPPMSYGFGRVAAPGDLNGDGYDDIVVGAKAVARSPVALLYVYHGGGPMWWRAPVTIFEREYSFDRSE